MGTERHPARAPRVVAAAAACVVGGLALSACSGAGTSLAEQACGHVDASIRLYDRAEHSPNAATARREARKATEQLAQAEQFAARATSADPSFNPLMTTIQENGRTSEANLIPALRAQCRAARHPTSAFGGAPGGQPGAG